MGSYRNLDATRSGTDRGHRSSPMKARGEGSQPDDLSSDGSGRVGVAPLIAQGLQDWRSHQSIRAARLQDVFIRSGRPEIRVPRLVSWILVLRTEVREGFVPHRGTPCHGRFGRCLGFGKQLPCRNEPMAAKPVLGVGVQSEFRVRGGSSPMGPDAGGPSCVHLLLPAKDRP